MSSNRHIQSKFEHMGAQVTIRPMMSETFRRHRSPLAIDVPRSATGEHFDIEKTRNLVLNVLDVQPRQRHLLLQVGSAEIGERFLCGHDEMHWFVASLPDGNEARNVSQAMEALKPEVLKKKERRRGRRGSKADLYVRQGEWFFIPWPHASIRPGKVIRNALLTRGPESKPHTCEFMFLDGEREYECARYPKLAFFESEYKHILQTRRKAKQWKWRELPFNPDRYVRGWVRHPDHNPLFLDGWHRVEMNTEGQFISDPLKPRMTRVVYRD